ncbi:MAG: hypothetical protein LBH75_06155, partial [Treponema sp.]|nr:hypothetical protein [Treponema sp.]
MLYSVENVVENIDFSMKMEDMHLTDEDKNRLRDCLNGTVDVDKILQEVNKAEQDSWLNKAREYFSIKKMVKLGFNMLFEKTIGSEALKESFNG